jgi:hypothetical protein
METKRVNELVNTFLSSFFNYIYLLFFIAVELSSSFFAWNLVLSPSSLTLGLFLCEKLSVQDGGLL